MNKEQFNLIQSNSPDGGFLQTKEWRKFQESVGRKTYNISSDNFWANVIEHSLPIVGKYLYIPRGPIFNFQFSIFNQFSNDNDKIFKQNIQKLINLAKENEAGWIRIEPYDSRIFDLIRENWRVAKAPHDMQPKEILILDITKAEEELLAEMKAKTRYNIKLAEKKGIKIFNFQFSIFNQFSNSNDQKENTKYINEFIRLVKITAKRDGIVSYPESYYRKMFEVIPGDILKLYVAEYKGTVIAANLVIFYGKVVTYLHGASDNNHRNLMAPYLLQWQAIQDAKSNGFERYDLGGVKIESQKSKVKGQNCNLKIKNLNTIPDTKYQIQNTSWSGITKFKTGFAPSALPVVFPGSYDIVLDSKRYWAYRMMQTIKGLFK